MTDKDAGPKPCRHFWSESVDSDGLRECLFCGVRASRTAGGLDAVSAPEVPDDAEIARQIAATWIERNTEIILSVLALRKERDDALAEVVEDEGVRKVLHRRIAEQNAEIAALKERAEKAEADAAALANEFIRNVNRRGELVNATDRRRFEILAQRAEPSSVIVPCDSLRDLLRSDATLQHAREEIGRNIAESETLAETPYRNGYLACAREALALLTPAQEKP